ncbi:MULTISPECIES: hypothetical protein [unclassified Streptomyces]|uniref:hypothetical protein n=1 Tax=unclassified Streptomyces TaxID=2593676 RepID=UPI0038685135
MALSATSMAAALTESFHARVEAGPRCAPDPYQAAAARFGALTRACVAVEDSPDGSASAQAAGCPVLVVPSLLRCPHRPAGSSRIAWRTWISTCSGGVFRPGKRGPDDGTEGLAAA